MISQFAIPWPFSSDDLKRIVADLGDDFSYSLMADTLTIPEGGEMPVWVSVEKAATVEALKGPLEISESVDKDGKVSMVKRAVAIRFVKALDVVEDELVKRGTTDAIA